MCGLEWLVQLANAAFFGGCLLGCAVFQLASERLGERLGAARARPACPVALLIHTISASEAGTGLRSFKS